MAAPKGAAVFLFLRTLSRGHAHIRFFLEKIALFEKKRIFALSARKKTKYDKSMT